MIGELRRLLKFSPSHSLFDVASILASLEYFRVGESGKLVATVEECWEWANAPGTKPIALSKIEEVRKKYHAFMEKSGSFDCLLDFFEEADNWSADANIQDNGDTLRKIYSSLIRRIPNIPQIYHLPRFGV